MQETHLTKPNVLFLTNMPSKSKLEEMSQVDAGYHGKATMNTTHGRWLDASP